MKYKSPPDVELYYRLELIEFATGTSVFSFFNNSLDLLVLLGQAKSTANTFEVKKVRVYPGTSIFSFFNNSLDLLVLAPVSAQPRCQDKRK